MLHFKTYCIVTEPRDVTLIACVEKDGRPIVPVLGVDEVALLERPLIPSIKMIYLQAGNFIIVPDPSTSRK